MAAEIPAGWYPNPWNDAEELYWSGTEWTGISRAVHRAAPSSGTPVMTSEIEEATIMRPALASTSTRDASPFAPPSVPGEPHPAATLATPTVAAPVTSSFAPPTSRAYPQTTSYLPPAQYAPAPDTAAPAAGVAEAAVADAAVAGAAVADAAVQDAPRPAAGGADAADATSIRWALGPTPAPPATNPRAKFGLVAMILGIVAAVFAVIPGLSFAAWLPAFVAIAFGIVGYLGGKPRGSALAGIITGGAALAVGTGMSIWLLALWGVIGAR